MAKPVKVRTSGKRRPTSADTTDHQISGSGDLASDIQIKVRDAIRKGTLPIGERVTEVDLAARFGVSRTPVRDAILRLEADGLLTNEPRRGLIVSNLNHQQVVELYFMREVLEGAAARLAAQSASDIELETISALSALESEPGVTLDALSDINVKIHNMIALAAHNRYLLRSLTQLGITMSLLPSLLAMGDRARSAASEHRAIVAALLERDSERAESAARAHVRSSLQHRLLQTIGRLQN
ncbi:DNA-binding GntR family transcriptional regulator [Bosea sp. OAE752]|uniref:GntR family transcriptional regulator n=1 Tax=Bosea TaxID=85413 RepID=UPI000AAEC184|nr:MULTISPECIES: GntR family transcriptional regulator [Bosea]MCT4473451.1 GntR family transcriptional regulator [Bosea spartocytisi]